MEKKTVQLIETPRLILRQFPDPPHDSESRDKWTKDVAFFSELRTDIETVKWATTDGSVDRDIAATEEHLRNQVDLAWAFIIELKDQNVINNQDEIDSKSSAINGIKSTETSDTKPRHTGVEGRQILGALGVKLPAENVKHAERLTQPMLGYLMHADSRGHGYVTEAARGLLTAFWRRADQLTKQYGLVYEWTGIEALTDTENPASARVLEKLGFQYVRVWERMFYQLLLQSDRDVSHYYLDRTALRPMEIIVTPSEPALDE